MVPTTAPEIAAHYSRMQIITATKARALCMLHEKVLFNCIRLRNDIGDYPVLAPRIQNILAQLQMSLVATDRISQGLFYLYDYCFILMNRPDEQAIENVFDIMLILFDTFNKIARHRN
jgi:flagellin-specific chaperone FliS